MSHPATTIGTTICGVRITPLRLTVVFLTAAMSIASLMPSDLAPRGPIDDKIAHLGAYLFLTGLGMAGVRSTSGRWVCFLGLVTLGGLLELGQLLVPGRTCDPLDMAANTCGAILAFSAGRIWNG